MKCFLIKKGGEALIRYAEESGFEGVGHMMQAVLGPSLTQESLEKEYERAELLYFPIGPSFEVNLDGLVKYEVQVGELVVGKFFTDILTAYASKELKDVLYLPES